jgi:hypothetical protein
MASLTSTGMLPAVRRGAATTPLPYVVDIDEVVALLRSESDGAARLRAELLPLLPPGQQDMTGLVASLRSPQLRQAMMSLTGALDTENAGPVFSNFGLRAQDGDAARARGDPVGALVAAVVEEAKRGEGSGEGSGAGAGSGAGSGSGSGSG